MAHQMTYGSRYSGCLTEYSVIRRCHFLYALPLRYFQPCSPNFLTGTESVLDSIIGGAELEAKNDVVVLERALGHGGEVPVGYDTVEAVVVRAVEVVEYLFKKF